MYLLKGTQYRVATYSSMAVTTTQKFVIWANKDCDVLYVELQANTV